MVELRDRVFEFIQANGPVIPIQIAKFLNSDTFLGSAVLGELLAIKKVKLTHAAVGGSRVYYISGQEAAVGDKLYPHLKSVERDAFDILKQYKVVRDKDMQSWCRVALRDLKDFAFPLNVTLENKNEIFWRFHLVTDTEAEEILQQRFGTIEEKPKEEKIVTEFTVSEEPIQEIFVKEIPVQESFVMKEIIEKPKEVQGKLTEVKPLKEKKTLQDFSGGFYDKVKQFFTANNITITEEKMIKKNKEFDFVVNVPSNVGVLKMYVKANSKKALNDNDLTLAYAEAQQKRITALFLGGGKLTKKAEEVINSKFSGQLIFKKI